MIKKLQPRTRDDQLVSVVLISNHSVSENMPLLESVGAQKTPWPVQLIFVQEACEVTDEELEAFPKKWVWVVVERGRGICYNRNRGIEAADGDVIVNLDDDCTPPEGWLEKIAGPVRRGETDISIGGVRIYSRTAFGRAVACLGFPAGGSLGFDAMYPVEPNGDTKYMTDGNCAMKREVFETVGLFNESTNNASDNEINMRVNEAGFRIRYYRDAWVWHPSRENMKDFLVWQFIRGQGKYELMSSNTKVDELVSMRMRSIKTVIRRAFTDRTYPLVLPLLSLSIAVQLVGYLEQIVVTKVARMRKGLRKAKLRTSAKERRTGSRRSERETAD